VTAHWLEVIVFGTLFVLGVLALRTKSQAARLKYPAG